MKVRIDYIYMWGNKNERDYEYGEGHIETYAPVNISQLISDIRYRLNEHMTGKYHAIELTLITDADKGPNPVLLWLFAAALVFFSGFLAAIICTGIMAMVR